MAVWFDGFEKLIEGEHTPRSNGSELDARVGRRGPSLMPDGVAFLAYDDIVPGTSTYPQGDLIRHRAGWKPECRLLTQKGGDAILQTIDGRILAELVVPDGRSGDGLTYLRRGPCDSV
jgi:hypothetical protein